MKDAGFARVNVGHYFKVCEHQQPGATFDQPTESMVFGFYSSEGGEQSLRECFNCMDTDCRRAFYPFRPPKSFPNRSKTGKSLNSTTKPTSLLRNLVQQLTKHGDLALDLLAGLGPLSEACLLEGRSVVALERDPEQRQYITARLNTARAEIERAGTKPVETASDKSSGSKRLGISWDETGSFTTFDTHVEKVVEQRVQQAVEQALKAAGLAQASPLPPLEPDPSAPPSEQTQPSEQTHPAATTTSPTHPTPVTRPDPMLQPTTTQPPIDTRTGSPVPTGTTNLPLDPIYRPMSVAV